MTSQEVSFLSGGNPRETHTSPCTPFLQALLWFCIACGVTSFPWLTAPCSLLSLSTWPSARPCPRAFAHAAPSVWSTLLLVPTLFSPSLRSDLCSNIIPHRGPHPSGTPHLLCFSSQHSSLPDYSLSLSFIVHLCEKSLQESGGFELLTAAAQGLELWLAQGGRSIWTGCLRMNE